MTRLVKGPAEPVGAPEIAPHHFRWDAIPDPPASSAEWRRWEPYKVGDVVWMQVDGDTAKRARILMMWPGRDRYGEIRTLYRVQIETKTGFWSKLWVDTYAGFIQRGYALAGATDDADASKILGRTKELAK